MWFFEDRVYAADDNIEPHSFKLYNINYTDFGVNVQHGLVAQFIFYGNDSESYLNALFKKKIIMTLRLLSMIFLNILILYLPIQFI